jgi:ribonuclease HI
LLGPPGTASNFECKLVGIWLALELGVAALSTRALKRIIILTDNQAAIERLRGPGAPKSGQYLLTQIQDLADSIGPSTDIVIWWCPGHSGIPGNELSDEKAAQARNTTLSDSSIRTSLASENSQLLPQQKVWKGAPRAPFTAQAAFHQLRSRHVHLNHFQFKIRQAPFPICEKCNLPKTVDHYLIACARFSKARVIAQRLLQR